MRHVHRFAVPAIVVVAALAAAACGSNGASGGSYSQAAPSTATTVYGQSPPSAAPSPGPAAPNSETAPPRLGWPQRVAVAESQLGQLIVDGSGHVLYLFEGDTTDTSTCNDACAQAWPPLLTVGSPEAGASVSQLDLTTSKRRDGTLQVAYHGHPLYSFVGDKRAGDTTGQGLTAFGARWYVVGTEGSKIDES
jgi:predicted lipoprotein with Yx(FWY)xxD motif